jgi:hypothetical protein
VGLDDAGRRSVAVLLDDHIVVDGDHAFFGQGFKGRAPSYAFCSLSKITTSMRFIGYPLQGREQTLEVWIDCLIVRRDEALSFQAA